MRLRLWLLAGGTFVLGIDALLLAGLLPAVADDLDVSLASAGRLTTVFALTYAVASPLLATATGRFDRRPVLLAGMAVFVAGMAAQAAGPTYGTVMAGRVLAGIGAAAYQANAYAVAIVIAPPERRGRALAVVAAGTSLANIAGVPLGVLVGQWIGWRGALWAVAGLALVAAATVLLLDPVRLDHVPLRHRLSLLARPRMLGLLTTTALVLVPQFTVVSYIAPVVGHTGQHAARTVVALVVFGTAYFVGNRLVGWLTDRRGPRPVLLGGLLVTTAALVALWTVQGDFALTLVVLTALGVAGPAQLTAQQGRVFAAAKDAGVIALGLNGSMIYLGSALGAVTGGIALDLGGPHAITLFAAGVAAASLLVVLAQRDKEAARAHGPDGCRVPPRRVDPRGESRRAGR